jgi:4-amino-4-deoxy-L-arabinose transferase-like glycosyltransferase
LTHNQANAAIEITRRPYSRRILPVAAVAIGLFALYFFMLGSYPMIDNDEPLYASAVKEMVLGGDWLTPHYQGKQWFGKPEVPDRKDTIWFDKPPLIDWLASTASVVFGIGELSCRLPSALFAVGLILMVYLLASFDFGRRVGVLSAAIMATCVQQIMLARACVTDMTFTFCLISALYAYRRWLAASGRSGMGWGVLCGAMTGLATVAKGPVAPLLVGVTIVIHLAWIRRTARLWKLDTLAAIAAWLVVGTPWFIAMYVMHGQRFVDYFLIGHNLARFTTPEHSSQTGGWYSYFLNVPIMLLMFFPWSLFVPQAIARGWRANEGARLAFVWAAVVFIFFSASKTILVTYVFPVYPVAAIFVGSLWASASSGDRASDKGLRAGLWAAFCFSVLLALAFVFVLPTKYPGSQVAGVVLGALTVIGPAVALFGWRKLNRRGIWAIASGMTAFAAWLIYAVMPFVVPYVSTGGLLRRIPRDPEAKYVAFGYIKRSLLMLASLRR